MRATVITTVVALFAMSVMGSFITVRAVASEGWEKLEKGYQDAHSAGDLDALKALVCWDGVPDRVRASVERSFASDLKRSVSGVSHKPISDDDVLEYELEGVRYRPNLEPVGWLVVSYSKAEDGKDSGVFTSTSYMVGIKDGVYMITTAVPVR